MEVFSSTSFLLEVAIFLPTTFGLFNSLSSLMRVEVRGGVDKLRFPIFCNLGTFCSILMNFRLTEKKFTYKHF